MKAVKLSSLETVICPNCGEQLVLDKTEETTVKEYTGKIPVKKRRRRYHPNKPRANKHYTKEEWNKLKEMAKHGYSARQIGLELNRTTSSIKNRLYYLAKQGKILQEETQVSYTQPVDNRGKPSTFTQEDLKRAKTLREHGLSYVRIAKIMDKSIYVIKYQLYTKTNLSRTGKREWTEFENNKLVEMYNNGDNPQHISNEIGRSVFALKSRLTYLKGRGYNIKGRKRI